MLVQTKHDLTGAFQMSYNRPVCASPVLELCLVVGRDSEADEDDRTLQLRSLKIKWISAVDNSVLFGAH